MEQCSIKGIQKGVLEFRSSLNEVVERAKSEKVMDFSEIVELIAKYGIVVKEIKCPVCGGKIDYLKKEALQNALTVELQ